jgi:hypothetical protein
VGELFDYRGISADDYYVCDASRCSAATDLRITRVKTGIAVFCPMHIHHRYEQLDIAIKDIADFAIQELRGGNCSYQCAVHKCRTGAKLTPRRTASGVAMFCVEHARDIHLRDTCFVVWFFHSTRHLVKRSCCRVCQAYLKEEVKKRPAPSAFASDDEEGERVKLTFWKIDGLLTASSKVICPCELALSNFSPPSSPAAHVSTMPPVWSSRCEHAVTAPNQKKV